MSCVPKEPTLHGVHLLDMAFAAWINAQRKTALSADRKLRKPARRSAPARGLQKYKRKVQSTKGKKAYSRKRKP